MESIKERYEVPVMEVTEFDAEDAIRTSNPMGPEVPG
jgi:hypothetical protein